MTSYTPPVTDARSRSHSGGNSGALASRYVPTGFGAAPPPPQQAMQSGGYLAPGPPQPLAMPEPEPAYRPSQLTYNAPPADMSQRVQHSSSYVGTPGPAGNPPYPTTPSAVPDYMIRPTVDGRRYSQSSQRSHRSNHSRHSHHSHRRSSDDYHRDQHSYEHSGAHHHSHQDYEPNSSHHHHHHYDSGSTKPLTRADTRRPTIGDTVISLVDGFKKYISK